MGTLQKISWKLRKTRFTFSLFDIKINDLRGCIGFSLFNIQYSIKVYSLFLIEFRLPNGGDIKEFTLDGFDFLFLREYLSKLHDNLLEEELWGMKSKKNVVKLRLLNILFGNN